MQPNDYYVFSYSVIVILSSMIYITEILCSAPKLNFLIVSPTFMMQKRRLSEKARHYRHLVKLIRTCPQEDCVEKSLLYPSISHAQVPVSFSSPWRRREIEGEKGKEEVKRERERERRIIIPDLLSHSLS